MTAGGTFNNEDGAYGTVYTVVIDELAVVMQIEETAHAQHVKPSDFIAVLVARALAPSSKLAHKLDTTAGGPYT